MLEKIFGPNPGPAILGYLTGGLLDLRVLIESGGTPTTFGGWSTLVMGVLMMAWGRASQKAAQPEVPKP
jgi:hypothetical protein